MDMEAVMRQLQNTLGVMDSIKPHHATVFEDQAEWPNSHETRVAEHERFMAESAQRMRELDAKVKALRALIDGMNKQQ